MDKTAPHPGESPPVVEVAGTATISRLSDRDLVRACREGSERAWAELVQRFSRYVYAIASQAYGLADSDADDVFQEVFARTYEHLGRLRADEAIRPWIGQLTRRLAIDRLRASSREQPQAEALEAAQRREEPELERIELALAVRAAMATLPEHCQEILDRFFAREQSYQEISSALGIPMGTIASRISRCLTKLRERLECE
ncbi:MAG: RNA polymerase sigma factor [Solirubrobacteraceae bacterium]